MGRNSKGLGSTYKEEARGGWVAEKTIRLPTGAPKRIRARGKTEREAIAARNALEKQAIGGTLDATRITMNAFMARWFDYKRPTSAPAHTRRTSGTGNTPGAPSGTSP